MRAQQKDRRDCNPAFGSRKLKLGTFQTNLDSGCVMSDLDGRLEITWPNTVTLAPLADEMEFEALVTVARRARLGSAPWPPPTHKDRASRPSPGPPALPRRREIPA